MIQVELVLAPNIDRPRFCKAAESVTGRNHVRSTDLRNLPNELSEVLSILSDFGGDGTRIFELGFLFVGSAPLVNKAVQSVGGRFLFARETTSDLLAAALVVAPLRDWQLSQPIDPRLESAWESIRSKLKPFSQLRLT